MAWTDDPLTENNKIKPVHIVELRDKVDQLSDVTCLSNDSVVFIGHYTNHENNNQSNVHASAESTDNVSAFTHDEASNESGVRSGYNTANLYNENTHDNFSYLILNESLCNIHYHNQLISQYDVNDKNALINNNIEAYDDHNYAQWNGYQSGVRDTYDSGRRHTYNITHDNIDNCCNED